MSDLFSGFDYTMVPRAIPKSYLTPFPTARIIGELKQKRRNSLICMIPYATVVSVNGNDMDATALKLLDRLKELEEQRCRITQEQKAIRIALEVAGVKPQGIIPGLPDQEIKYKSNNIFKGRALPACCEIVLKDKKGEWLTKSQIEYLIIQGGYEFTTGKPKNSVGVTLQRMAEQGLCEVERVKGQQGNRYRWPLATEQEKTP